MSPITFVRIEADILRRADLTDKQKMLLGLIQSFDGKGLMLSNTEIAKLLCTSEDYVTKMLRTLRRAKLVRIKNAQSRYRRVFFGGDAESHSDPQGGVGGNLLRPTGRLLRPTGQATPTHRADITKGKNKQKRGCAALSPSAGPADPDAEQLRRFKTRPLTEAEAEAMFEGAE